MTFEGQAYPSVENRGANLPTVNHAGLTKGEYLFTAAVAGALASGKTAGEALTIARAVVSGDFDTLATGTTTGTAGYRTPDTKKPEMRR